MIKPRTPSCPRNCVRWVHWVPQRATGTKNDYSQRLSLFSITLAYHVGLSNSVSPSQVIPYVNVIQEQTEKMIPRCFSNYPWNALVALFIAGLLWQLLSRPLPQFIGYLAFSILFTTIWLKHAGLVVTRNYILLKHYYRIHEDAADPNTNSSKRRRSEGPCGVPLRWCWPTKKENARQEASIKSKTANTTRGYSRNINWKQ